MNRIISTSLIISLALGALACSEGAPTDPDKTTIVAEPAGMVISNVQSSATTAGVAGARGSAATSNETGIAYVSAAPQTFPDAVDVRIRNRTTGGAPVLTKVIDGGFDPVQIQARPGDALEITLWTAGGTTKLMAVSVPVRRAPAVVRSNPAKHRVDAALTANVGVIFSEPIDPKTLSSMSLHLLHDGNPVSGTVRLSDNAWTAEFVPDKPLVPIPDANDPSRSVSFQRGASTDGNGRYAIKGFPNGVFSIVAGDDGYGRFGLRYDQPCAVEIELVAPTATADVELFSVDSPMPDAIRSPPLLTGIVFEQAENGRRPLAGAKIFLETSWGGAEARTTTDENGRYALCRVPYGALYAQKLGYEPNNGEPYFVGLVNLAGLTEKQLDIEMKRSQ